MRSRFSRVALVFVALSTALGSGGLGQGGERHALAADSAEPFTAMPLAQVRPTTDDLTDLAVTLVDSTDPVRPGGELVYTATVLNGANPFFSNTATRVDFTQKFSAGVTVLSAESTNGRACAGSPADPSGRPLARLGCNLGLLTPGASATVRVTVRVDPLQPTPTTVRSTAKVTLTSNPTGDLNTDNNRVTQSTAVVAP